MPGGCDEFGSSPRRPVRVQSLKLRPVPSAHLGSGLCVDNPAGMSSVQTQSVEQFMAGKHSDAKRIKQVDNLYGKEDFTIHKLPAELPLTCI